MESNFNLYADEKEPIIQIQQDDFPVTLDLERDSINEMIQKVRSKSLETNELNLYIVSGFMVKQDIELFIDYLKRLDQKITIYIRGIIHPSFIHILFFPNVLVEQKVRFIYKTDELHLCMKNLMLDPKIFRTFVQRYIDEYNKHISNFYLDTTELKTLGFNFETF